ncbi:zf-HC2 domain-containing protein [Streptomyces apocyni]|uniref:zf-HC2 domain-containing protein n=1 Tax=Streptomyces apocyni TaxID=2654677 RepID=UPI0012EAEA9E|nr:zf-HC2 domain-containing protein [Streptomyces apocyni]
MNGSCPTPAEQHLGDRLAALVDGELGHDTRERVLAHLATCPKCKAEADAQRRLKTVFASTAPPGPSASFLARLQGLPSDGGDGRGDSGAPLDGLLATDAFGRAEGVFAVRQDSFGYGPARSHGGLVSGPAAERGFRIHEVGRSGAAERSGGSRGRRFAFAAAGAVSLAALALGGVSTGAPTPAESAEARGAKASPQQRAPGSGAASGAETQRRRGGQLAASQGQAFGVLAAPVASPGVTGPAVPGVQQRSPQALTRPYTAPLLSSSGYPLFASDAALWPLIRGGAEAASPHPTRPSPSAAPAPSAPLGDTRAAGG